VRALRLAVCAALVAVGAGVDAVPPDLAVQSRAATGSLPKGVSISPDGRTLYVTSYGNVGVRSVGVYEAATLRRTGWIDVAGVAVESVAAPDGATLYVSDFRRDAVAFIDLARGRVRREVRVGARPKVLALTRDGARLFAANWSGRSVSEVDTATGAVVRTLPAGECPRGMAVARDGTLYVANFHGDSIDVFAGPDRASRTRLEGVCRVPRHLALSPDDATLYVSCLGDDAVAVIDAATRAVTRRVPVGAAPKALDVSADGSLLATADYGGSTVTLVDTRDWTTRTVEVPTLDHASGIVADRRGARFFVTGWYDNHVYAIGAAGGEAFVATGLARARTRARRAFHAANPVE
jgi:YVTN family beta-propeller protein